MAFDDKFGYHEVLDRTHVIGSMFDDHIMSHPVIGNDPVLKAQAEKAEAALGGLYQMIGQTIYETFGEGEG